MMRAFSLAIVLIFAGAAHAACVSKVYETTTKYLVSPEQIDHVSIQIASLKQPVTYAVGISLPVGQITPGDIIAGSGEMEVTNDTGSNVMIMSALLIGTGPADTAGVEYIAGWNGYNVTPDMHHGVVTKSQTHVAVHALAQGYVNLVLRSGRTSPTATGSAVLTVPKGYGKVSVEKTTCSP